jgi:xanthine dehydrogenase accessory factor
MPTIRIQLIGAGPSVPAIAHLLTAIGFGTEIVCPDEATRKEARSFNLDCKALTNSAIEALQGDRWSAAILAFHEHDWEIPLLERLLDSDCFYIGVLGSKTVAERRVAELHRRGIAPEKFARLRAPVGLIPGAKSRLSLAVSVVAELVSEAKKRSILE